jgi:hypothetical protein
MLYAGVSPPRPSATLRLHTSCFCSREAATFPLFLVLLIDSSSRLPSTKQAIRSGIDASGFGQRWQVLLGFLAADGLLIDARRPGAAAGSTNAGSCREHQRCSYLILKNSKELQYFIILYSISLSLNIQ